MSAGPPEVRNKQWDVKSINIEAVGLSYWGMHPELMTLLLQLPDVRALDIHAGEKDLISYAHLKKIVRYIHGEGIDTSVLSIAARQLIEQKPPDGNGSAKTVEEEVRWVRKNQYVLVVGTGKPRLNPVEQSACTAVGGLLASEGYGVITGGWPGVDQQVSEAYLKKLDEFGGIFRSDLVLHYMMGGDKPAEKQGAVVDIAPGTWFEHTLSRVIAVIMIGGEGGTYETYQSAQRARVPVIPISSTGGDAERAFREIILSTQLEIPKQLLESVNRPEPGSKAAGNRFSAEALQKILSLLNKRAIVAPVNFPAEWLDTTEELNGISISYDDPEKTIGSSLQSRGNHKLQLPDRFRLGKFPVTNEFFLAFLNDYGYENPRHWTVDQADRRTFTCSDKRNFGPATWQDSSGYPEGLRYHPVCGISFHEAIAFCNWLNEKRPPASGWKWALPTEDIWEFVARGIKGDAYPWGPEFLSGFCNSVEAAQATATPIRTFPNGATPTGCYDMAGNVWEFVDAAGTEEKACVLRGGSFKNNGEVVGGRLRLYGVSKLIRPVDFGFRLSMIREEFSPAPIAE